MLRIFKKRHNFWQRLSSGSDPFFCLAPMEDVTDIAFREMFVRYSKQCRQGTPSDIVLFTEFTPSDGLAFGDERAQERLRAKLSYTEGQRPIVAQIYNSNPKRMESAARLVQELGFDGVDINMGCPVNAVVKQVSGAALIRHPELAVELMRAVRKGAPKLPLSVKTRIGYSSVDDINTWIPTILKEKPDALTVHLRTRSQMSKVPAQWEHMRQIVKWRDELSPSTVLIGNGDVQSVEQGTELAKEYGCEGIMVGRAAFGTPDFFSTDLTPSEDNLLPAMPTLLRSRQQSSDLGHITEQAQDMSSKPKSCGGPTGGVFTGSDVTKTKKIKMLIEHIKLFDELLLKPGHKGYHVMKKHYKAYINGWDGAKELRKELMATESPEEAIKLLQKYRNRV